MDTEHPRRVADQAAVHIAGTRLFGLVNREKYRRGAGRQRHIRHFSLAVGAKGVVVGCLEELRFAGGVVHRGDNESMPAIMHGAVPIQLIGRLLQHGVAVFRLEKIANPMLSTVGKNLRPAFFDDGGNFLGRFFQPKGERNHAPDGSAANQVEAPGDGFFRALFQPRQDSGGVQATESAARQRENVESVHAPYILPRMRGFKCPNQKMSKSHYF